MLVGRDREVTAIEAGLAQLGAGRGGLYLLVGEPGIGKTRLASELATRAADRQIRVSWGRCWEAGGAPAFWPWQEALSGLSTPFPDGGTVGSSDPAESRFALLRAVASELARIAATGSLLLIFEDLHAADQSSLLLLELVANQVRSLPVAVIGTYRDLEASLRPEVGDALARIGRNATVLPLARLREAEVAAVVRETVDDADDRLIAMVYDTTHGNPLFVSEIVRQVRVGGASTGTIPLGVREVIRQRLSLVSPAARRVLDAAAVLGVELGMREVARMAPDAAAELDAAARSGLVTMRGDRVRFAHALYREALYHDLPRATRQALHRDAARALIATNALEAEIAHHLLEAGPDAAVEGIDHAIAAARQALDTFAYEDAAAILERARLAIPEGPLEATLRCRVTIALGEVRLRAGDPTGRELCVEAARIARELDDAALIALAGLAYGSVFAIGGVDPVMVGILEDALARLPTADAGLRARTMARLGAARQPGPPAERQRDIDLALAAIDMGHRVASRREMLEILQSASGALYGAADPRVRMPLAREQEQLAQELGDTPRLLAARARLAIDYLELADFAAYAQNAAAYEQLAARIGRAALPWRVPLMRSMVAITKDDFAESERWQAEARALESEQPRARRAQAFHRICFLRAAERHAELRAAIPELRSLWNGMPYGRVLAEPRVASALMRIGADDEVREILAALPASSYEEQINGLALAEAIWCTADREQAQRLMPVAESFGGRWAMYWLDVELAEAPASRLLAYLVGIAGDWPRCDRLFAQALREVENVGMRTMAARMRFELGDLLVRCGLDSPRARALLAEARALAAALGRDELVALIDRRHPQIAPLSPVASTPSPHSPVAAAPAPTAIAPAPAAPPFAMTLEGEYYAIATTRGTLRFKATRGMQYLARLVDNPATEIHVLDLAGSSDADRGDAGELLDARGFSAYRARVESLRDVIEDAEARGDTDRAEHAREELEALAQELGRASRPGGRAKRGESAVDRARSAVTRRIKDALDRIAEQDSALGAWLRRAVSTGNHCSFDPMR
ncbi:MAG TPA: AAA family ATPase [Kofleriaceae bacterium]|nr:AAA family ATPase [Kofleriaceae bacterium]